MTAEQFAFFALSAVAVASALGVILYRNAVYSMLSLIVNLLSLAGFFLLLQSMFIATIQVLIYAGAVMVLFLFVVTMLTPDAASVGGRDRLRWQWGAGAGLALILAAGLAYAISRGTLAQDACALGNDCLSKQVQASGGPTEAFGLALFHGFAFPFELTSVLLVVAVLGAVALGRRVVRQQAERAQRVAERGPAPTSGTTREEARERPSQPVRS